MRLGLSKREGVGTAREVQAREWKEIAEKARQEEAEQIKQAARTGTKEQRVDPQGGWFISSVSEGQKLSEWYVNCTGLFVTGIDAKTGKPISLLSHQVPGSSSDQAFHAALEGQLALFKARAKPGSVTAGYFGGQTGSSIAREMYKRDKNTIGTWVKAKLGVTMKIQTGPLRKNEYGGVHISEDGSVQYCTSTRLVK